MANCRQCGETEEDCKRLREAFRTEPHVGGFVIGTQWTSYDGGATWSLFPPPDLTNEERARARWLTIVDVDEKAGAITAKGCVDGEGISEQRR